MGWWKQQGLNYCLILFGLIRHAFQLNWVVNHWPISNRCARFNHHSRWNNWSLQSNARALSCLKTSKWSKILFKYCFLTKETKNIMFVCQLSRKIILFLRRGWKEFWWKQHCIPESISSTTFGSSIKLLHDTRWKIEKRGVKPRHGQAKKNILCR